ncbi:MAG: DUF4278 domain-containing protein [Cyanosarcina radialis HA8281-LM2]|jgi:hypothetical protein|nr:DUF4278 domain-containing protein [Cyanosarcina radialis HA8281-LM2]
MFQLTNGTQVPSAAKKSISSKSTYALAYRGTSYEAPKNQISETTDRSIDQKLIYRGAKYAIDREVVLSPLKSGRYLTYRGANYAIADA